ncbi:hypothetical protein [Lysinibacillus telephonicus]|uniref:hypothetical protein n=1 Tax=Lysinibacillus telephonicus TaxID=1714840 RepID=UPI003B9DE764
MTYGAINLSIFLEAGTKLKDAIFLDEKNDVFLLSGKLISVPGMRIQGWPRASSSLHSCGISSHGLFPQEALYLTLRFRYRKTLLCSERRSRQLHSPLHSNQFSKIIKFLLMIKANFYKKSTYVPAPLFVFMLVSETHLLKIRKIYLGFLSR